MLIEASELILTLDFFRVQLVLETRQKLMQSIAVQIVAVVDSRRSHDAFQPAANAFIKFGSSPCS
jgi:hypothetical protein